MIPRDELWCILAAIALCLLLAPCSGGGPGGGPGPAPDNTREVLSWVQPPRFEDNTALDLRRDIGLYEIHLSDNAVFADNTCVAVVKPLDNAGAPSASFDLRLLAPYGVDQGPLGTFLTVRSLGVDNAASGFGDPTFWER